MARTRNAADMQMVKSGKVTLLPAPPQTRHFRLTSARGVRRELAAVYAEFRNGRIDADTAKTAGFLLRCLLEAIRIDEIETRLEVLENHP